MTGCGWIPCLHQHTQQGPRWTGLMIFSSNSFLCTLGVALWVHQLLHSFAKYPTHLSLEEPWCHGCEETPDVSCEHCQKVTDTRTVKESQFYVAFAINTAHYQLKDKALRTSGVEDTQQSMESVHHWHNIHKGKHHNSGLQCSKNCEAFAGNETCSSDKNV